jgi:hypothetical protein
VSTYHLLNCIRPNCLQRKSQFSELGLERALVTLCLNGCHRIAVNSGLKAIFTLSYDCVVRVAVHLVVWLVMRNIVRLVMGVAMQHVVRLVMRNIVRLVMRRDDSGIKPILRIVNL